jgi:hypothetical protein
MMLRKNSIWKVFNWADNSRPPMAMAMKDTSVPDIQQAAMTA